ncbi:MAG: protein-export chaperone SecB [Hyphomicrobiales bacterium]|nr:protein-export chaperone SecB [Hyphomicrobiales bacterium]
MADENQGAEAAGQLPPQLNILAQYLKDLSFENPNAPASLQPRNEPPKIEIGVKIETDKKTETEYEIDLKIEARGTIGKDMLFNVEVQYAGIIRVQNIPAEHLQPVIEIEGPRMLFPFARQIIADATRNGGFPPLLIDPIDFASLYRQKVMEGQNAPATMTPN